MPDVPAQPGMPAAPPPAQAGAPGPASGQPSFGSSPVSQPVANKGHQAAGLSRLSVAVKVLEEALPLLGAATEPGQAVITALKSLSKHVPAGAVSPGVQQSTMEKLMLAQKQAGPQVAAMRGPQPQAAPPAQPAAA